MNATAENLKTARIALLKNPPIHGGSLAWSAALTRACDAAWQQIHHELVHRFPAAPPIAIVATACYGRTDLTPHSHLDVAIIPATQSGQAMEEAVHWIFREAREVFIDNGVSLGYSYRTVADVPGFDSRILSALVDARFVAGNPEPLEDLMAALWKSFPIGEFIVAKKEERSQQMQLTHDTPLVVEPNLKLGCGGLRCVQTARTIRAALAERPFPFPPSYATVHGARVLLQYLAKKNTDELTRPRLEEVAELMQMDAGSLASALASAMEDNHEVYLESLERVQESRFALYPGVEVVRGEARPMSFSTVGQACVGTHLALKLGLRITNGWASLDPHVGHEVLDLLVPAERTIRCWHRCGLLAKALPELERCHSMISDDATHKYTVFEHTLQAARLIDRVPASHPIASIKAAVPEQGLLMLAVLLHDLGKADRRASHSETGARMAVEVCQRWGVDSVQSAFVEWMVLHHRAMAKFLRMRDVERPQTAREFAEVVQTQEKLDALTVLTWADVQAVSHEEWTPLQEKLLLDLHAHTTHELSDKDGKKNGHKKDPIKPNLTAEANADAMAAFIESLPSQYLLSSNTARLQQHLAMAQTAATGEVVVESRDLADVQATEISVCCPDGNGVLAKVMGVLYAHDTTLISVRAATTSGDHPLALDAFTLQASRKSITKPHLARIIHDLTLVLKGAGTVEEILGRTKKDPTKRQKVIDINVIESDVTIIEIKAPRGRGMAYRVARVITEQGWNIHAARIGQWAGVGTAAFYVSATDKPISTADVHRALKSQRV